MKNLRYIAILLTALLANGTQAQKYFKVVEATSMAFAGGTPQSGTGVNYRIKIKLLTSQQVTFNDIWIGKEYGKPELVSSHSDGRKPVKGDTVTVLYSIHHYPPNSPLDAAKPEYKSAPIPIQGEALLGFTVGSATRYRSVEKFKSLPPVSYP